MADTARPSSGGDQESREQQQQQPPPQLSLTTPKEQQPKESADNVEMDDLSPSSKTFVTASTPPHSAGGVDDTTASTSASASATATAPGNPPNSSSNDLAPPARLPLPGHDDSFYTQASANTSKANEDAAVDAPEAPLPPSSKALGKAPATSSPPPEGEQDAAMDINPAGSEGPGGATEGGDKGDPALRLQIIMPNTGTKHPFVISAKYLGKRNVAVPGKTEDGRPDPFSITVYTLKELILREWRKEWDTPPQNPALIRLIHMGMLLDDRQPMNSYRLNKAGSSIIHMALKPQEALDDEEAHSKVRSNAASGQRSCCCVIL